MNYFLDYGEWGLVKMQLGSSVGVFYFAMSTKLEERCGRFAVQQQHGCEMVCPWKQLQPRGWGVGGGGEFERDQLWVQFIEGVSSSEGCKFGKVTWSSH